MALVHDDIVENKEPVLEVRNISKSFPGVRALKNVNFNLFAGEVHAIVGENGAGKSTLIKIISGNQGPDSGGEILYKSKPVRLASPAHALSLGISAVFQEFAFCPDLSVLENLFLGRPLPRQLLGSVDWSAARREAKSAFAKLSFDIDLDMRMRDASPTMRRITEIARALLQKASIAIFDEPTAALPEHETDCLFSAISLLRNMGVGVIYISHRLNEIFKVADRVTIFRDGEVIGTHKVTELDTSSLIKMMVGRPLDKMYEKSRSVTDKVVFGVRKLSGGNAFKEISFDLNCGEILGIGGLIGSGRSELVQSIAGARRPNSGSVMIDGKEVRIRSVQDAMRHGIALVPEDRQSQGLVLGMHVSDNMTLPSLKTLSQGLILLKKRQIRAAKVIAERLRIVCASLLQPVRRLSGGNQQKVVLGKWLMTRPRVLILDEPTRGIDVGAKTEIYSIMNAMASQGLAIIMISSELPELLAMSDRILVLHEGTLTGEFLQSEATQEKIMRAATATTPKQ